MGRGHEASPDGQVNITLCGRFLQIKYRCFPVTGNFTPAEIQLAKDILGILISLLCRGGQPADGCFHILLQVLSHQIQSTEPVLGVFVFLVRRQLEHSHRL